MDATDFSRLQALFERALALPADARAGFVAELQGPDAALRSELQALLDTPTGTHDPLASLVGRAAEAVLAGAPVARVAADETIGPWRILAHIADGGMGAIYRAERADGQDQQQVAIKLINPAFVSGAAAERLAFERRILARLEHPAIARLLDGGTRADGTPYLAMEFVDGLRIDAYCAQQQLDTRARLVLLLTLCDAVEHAHRNLVVHRDIKPANVLVDRDGRPRLLDFGIGKLLDDDNGLTRADQRALTPGYASPEQIRGEPITTEADVYSLGALLYELLAGRPAFAGEGGSARQLMQEVLGGELLAPSAAVRRLPNQRADDAPAAARIASGLAGDLDNIVLKAMHREPARRYESARALAEDIGRHLNDLPVQARPDAFGYRLSKFLRRHRSGAAVAGAVALGTVALVSFYTWRLSAEQQRALAEARTANRVALFMQELFEGANPQETGRKSLSADELLQRAAERVDRELADEPHVRARLLAAMGRSNMSLGHYGVAEQQYRTAMALYTRPEDHDPRCAVERALAELLGFTGNRDEAVELLSRCASDAPAGQLDRIQAIHVGRLGAFDVTQGRYEQGLARLQRARSALQRLHQGDTSEMYEATSLLAVALGTVGRMAESARLAREAADVARRAFGDTSVGYGQELNNLSWASRQVGDGAQALAAAEQAHRILSALFAIDNFRVINARHQIARSLAFVGRHEEAVTLAERTLEIEQRAHGPVTGPAMNTVSVIIESQMALGRFDDADALATRTLAQVGRADGLSRLVMCEIAGHLGDLRAARGDPRGAEAALRQGLAVLGDDEGPGQMRTGLRERLAWVLLRLGRVDDGDALYRQAVAEGRAAWGSQAPDVFGRVLGGYAEWLDGAGRADAASTWRREHAAEIAAGATLLTRERERLARLRATAASAAAR